MTNLLVPCFKSEPPKGKEYILKLRLVKTNSLARKFHMKENKIISAGVAAVMLAVSEVGFAAEYSGAHG